MLMARTIALGVQVLTWLAQIGRKDTRTEVWTPNAQTKVWTPNAQTKVWTPDSYRARH